MKDGSNEAAIMQSLVDSGVSNELLLATAGNLLAMKVAALPAEERVAGGTSVHVAIPPRSDMKQR